jgi:hypothetical protein
VEAVWFSRTSYGYGDLRIVKEFYRRFIIFLRLWNGCGFSATSHPQATMSGQLWEVRQRRRTIDMV